MPMFNSAFKSYSTRKMKIARASDLTKATLCTLAKLMEFPDYNIKSILTYTGADLLQ
jgi:hypothetical protein